MNATELTHRPVTIIKEGGGQAAGWLVGSGSFFFKRGPRVQKNIGPGKAHSGGAGAGFLRRVAAWREPSLASGGGAAASRVDVDVATFRRSC